MMLSSRLSAAFRLLVLAGVAGWMLRIRGESLTGTEPAETRCLKALMSRGVGFGGSGSVVGGIGVVVVVGWLLVDGAAICGADGALFLRASCSI